MIHSTRPDAASTKCDRISVGRIRRPGWSACCMPPRWSHTASSAKPPSAVITHKISAAHFIAVDDLLVDVLVFVPRSGDGLGDRPLLGAKHAGAVHEHKCSAQPATERE